MSLSAWLLAVMLAVRPPGGGHGAAAETPDEGRARYEAIADALAGVVETEPPIYSGPRGRALTAALVLSIAYHESGWRRDVDLGIGPYARGSGVDGCMMQIRLSRGATTREGWTAEELAADREKCFRAGLHLARRSFTACRKLPVEERLAAYAGGSCERGHTESRAIVAMQRRWLARWPAPTSAVEKGEPMPAVRLAAEAP